MTAKKKQKLRNNEYYGIQDTLDMLYKESKEGKKFKTLIPLIMSEENILLAYRNIKKNYGSTTPGTNGRTIEYFKTKDNEYIVKYVRSRILVYTPQSIKKVEIPKSNGGKRPLGISTIGDRLVQQCILQILEPIVEAKFYKHSYGFRPLRNAKNAMAAYYKCIQQMNMYYVVDVDIKGFFDNINHGKLLKQLWAIGIQDKKLISIISSMLKAEVANIGFPEKGTPQGGIISPLLANIVLNELDWWVADQWETFKTKYPYKHNKGQEEYLMPANKRKALHRASNLKEGYIIRYADDFKIICKDYETATKWFFAVKGWLKNRLGLDINEEKSKVVNLKTEWSEFLGLKIKATRKGNNKRTKKETPKYVVESHICDKAVKRIQKTAVNRIKDIIKEGNKDKLPIKIAKYNAFVFGVHNYYDMATHVVKDVNKADYLVFRTLEHRAKIKLKPYKEGDKISSFMKDKYGKSRRLKMYQGHALAPLSYIQQNPPKLIRGDATIYTKEGREKVHDDLNENIKGILSWMMVNPIEGETVEYNDNRLSLFSAQKGKCAVTGIELDIDDIRCHHKKPRSKNGTDEYSNLIIISDNAHKLIHATNKDTTNKYLKLMKLNKEQLKKINSLRKMVGNEEI